MRIANAPIGRAKAIAKMRSTWGMSASHNARIFTSAGSSCFRRGLFFGSVVGRSDGFAGKDRGRARGGGTDRRLRRAHAGRARAVAGGAQRRERVAEARG